MRSVEQRLEDRKNIEKTSNNFTEPMYFLDFCTRYNRWFSKPLNVLADGSKPLNVSADNVWFSEPLNVFRKRQNMLIGQCLIIENKIHTIKKLCIFSFS
jgi:hypothetical protein